MAVRFVQVLDKGSSGGKENVEDGLFCDFYVGVRNLLARLIGSCDVCWKF